MAIFFARFARKLHEPQFLVIILQNCTDFLQILTAMVKNKTILRPDEIPLDVFLEEIKFYDLEDETLESFLFYEGIFDEEPEIPTPTLPNRLSVYKFVHTDHFPYARPTFWSELYRFSTLFLIFISIFIFTFESLFHEDKEMIEKLVLLEEICDLWFFVEFCLHWYACEDRIEFFYESETLLDILALIPFMFYILNEVHKAALEHNDANGQIDPKEAEMLEELQSGFSKLRILHVVRICKLGKYSRGVKILGKTIIESRQVLTILGTMAQRS